MPRSAGPLALRLRTTGFAIASAMILSTVASMAPGATGPALAAEPDVTRRVVTEPTWPADFVRAEGTRLVVDGRPYRFTGINIYNANNRGDCWYRMSGPSLEQSMDRLPRDTTAIRAWFFQRIATRGGKRDWTAFDHTLAAARERGIRVIVTLADHWGACERSGVKPVAFYAGGYRRTVERGNRTTYRRWVAEVVRRYRDDPTVLMWQLMNEAEIEGSGGRCAPSSILRDFAGDMAGVVKAIDPYHLLSLGTIGTGQCGVKGDAYRRLHAIEGIDICEYHDYGERSSNPKRDPLTIRIDQCRSLGKPLFIGEMGVDGVRDLHRRAARIIRQVRSHLNDGAVGVLMWNWRDRAHGGSSRGGFEIGPGDPALAAIGIEHSLPDPHLIRWLTQKRGCAEHPADRNRIQFGQPEPCLL